jgi:preprotein translocase SecE subunit
MAEKPEPKTRKLKPAQTVRERTKTGDKPKKRRLKQTANAAAKPVKLTGEGLGIIFRPLGFLLKPFKTRPVRFVGRILATVLLLRYFYGSWQELRQVQWPTRRQTFSLTMAVFVFATIFGLIIAAVDFGLDKLFRAILIK